MGDTKKTTPRNADQNKSRMPDDSVFYEKVIPALLIGMAIITVVFILIALDIMLGLVPYV